MYQRRIRSLKTELCLVRPNKSPDRAPAEARAEEAARLLKRLDPRGITIALDVKGDLWSSEDVAKRLEGWMNRGVKTVSFLLGGAHGLAPEDLQTMLVQRLRWARESPRTGTARQRLLQWLLEAERRGRNILVKVLENRNFRFLEI